MFKGKTHFFSPKAVSHVLVVSILIAFVTACAPQPVGVTIIPARTPTITPTPLPTRTPTPDFASLLPNAAELCKVSFSKELSGTGILPGKIFILIKVVYKEGAWEIKPTSRVPYTIDPSYLNAGSPSEVAALVCIRESRKKAGSYMGGGSAFRVYWDVRITSWPDGQVIASKDFAGGDPPDKTSSSGHVHVFPPGDEFAKWLNSLVLPSVQKVMVLACRNLGGPSNVVFSPDGRLLASDNLEGIKLWKVETGQELAALIISHAGPVSSVVFSPDGKLLASGSRDKTVKLWDVGAGEEVITLVGHKSHVHGVAFSPDGKLLASGSHDQTVKLWKVKTGKEVATLVGHKDAVYRVAFSPGGKLLASNSQDKTVKLWEVETGEEVATLTGYRPVFSPDGKLLAAGSGDDIVILWEVETRKKAATLDGHVDGVDSVAFSPDGKILASTCRGTRVGDITLVKLWEVETGEELMTIESIQDVSAPAFSPDGKLLSAGSHDWTVKLWEVETGREIVSFVGHADEASSVVFSPDGKLLASGSSDDTVILWRVPVQY